MVRPKLWDMLLGQFPHHGDAYYRIRITRLRKAGQPDLLDLNDLAVAHVRLKEFDEAWKALESAKQLKPDHYETLSNMGVTAKKQGDFEKGAEFIAKALELKPEGHMGLGDWYLKALRWRAKFESASGQSPPSENFLGKTYATAFSEKFYGMEDMPREAQAPNERYEQLIRNDQSFADGFMAVGDALTSRGDLNLSFFAYLRAEMHGHQNPDEVKRRIAAYLKHHETYLRTAGTNLRGASYQKTVVASGEKKIKDGLAWLEQFKSVEAELLKGKTDERQVNFDHVEGALLQRGIRRVYLG